MSPGRLQSGLVSLSLQQEDERRRRRRCEQVFCVFRFFKPWFLLYGSTGQVYVFSLCFGSLNSPLEFRKSKRRGGGNACQGLSQQTESPGVYIRQTAPLSAAYLQFSLCTITKQSLYSAWAKVETPGLSLLLIPPHLSLLTNLSLSLSVFLRLFQPSCLRWRAGL